MVIINILSYILMALCFFIGIVLSIVLTIFVLWGFAVIVVQTICVVTDTVREIVDWR